MIKEIKRCEDCPFYKDVDLGMGGGYNGCMAEEPLYGKKVDHILAYRGRPNWCPFKVGDKIEFVFAEQK